MGSRLRRWAERGLFVLALVALGAWGLFFLEAQIYQASAARHLGLQGGAIGALVEGAERLAGLGANRSPRSEVKRGEPFGLLEIPRLGISVFIAEGDDSQTLRRAVGHIPGTAFPGEEGNIGLAGHRDTFFRGLKEAQRNDLIRIETPQGAFEYLIDTTSVVMPNRMDVLAISSEPSLTLVTCYPFHYIGRAPERFIVRARQVGP